MQIFDLPYFLEFHKSFEEDSLKYFKKNEQHAFATSSLEESKKYSFFSGGKRFRPYLSFLVSRIYGQNFHDIFPFLLSVEMVHTYSLIHDDLPSLDNDDLRRGQPTNHKKFGEALALLAGDALLSDSLGCLTEINSAEPKRILACIHEFAMSIGSLGMVSGQVRDVQAVRDVNYEDMLKIHQLKTAQLIAFAISGVALLFEVDKEKINLFKNYGTHLGLAFQIKDDLLDVSEKEQSHRSTAHILGIEKAKLELDSFSQLARSNAQEIGSSDLELLVDYNLLRKQ